MARVLLTGMSGTGKSTLLDVLGERGHQVLDTDYGGWTRDASWEAPRMRAFLEMHSDVIVSGTVENQAAFYPWFAHVVLLSAPLPVLLERLSTRTTNPYGKTEEERAEVARHLEQVEPLLRLGATIELDARSPVEALADSLKTLLNER